MVSAVSEVTGAIGFRDARVLLRQDLMLGPLNWLIEPNQKWLIVGRNGAGKSALVAALQGEGERISGDIWYNDDEAAVVSTEIQKTLLEEERIRCEGQDERISGTPVSAVLRALSRQMRRSCLDLFSAWVSQVERLSLLGLYRRVKPEKFCSLERLLRIDHYSF